MATQRWSFANAGRRQRRVTEEGSCRVKPIFARNCGAFAALYLRQPESLAPVNGTIRGKSRTMNPRPVRHNGSLSGSPNVRAIAFRRRALLAFAHRRSQRAATRQRGEDSSRWWRRLDSGALLCGGRAKWKRVLLPKGTSWINFAHVISAPEIPAAEVVSPKTL